MTKTISTIALVCLTISCSQKTDTKTVETTPTAQENTSAQNDAETKTSYNYLSQYKSEEGEVLYAIYFEKEGELFIKIKKNTDSAFTLPQTKAWAKGAEYERDTLLWIVQGNQGVLMENGVSTKYTQHK